MSTLVFINQAVDVWTRYQFKTLFLDQSLSDESSHFAYENLILYRNRRSMANLAAILAINAACS